MIALMRVNEMTKTYKCKYCGLDFVEKWVRDEHLMIEREETHALYMEAKKEFGI